MSHCDAKVPVEVKNFLIQKFFLSAGLAGFPVGSQAQCTGAGRQWGRTSWGNIPGAERRGARGQWAGVAELGGPGGPWPPQKFEWVGQGMFWPPQNFDHWPPQNGPPVVKISAKLLLSILKCAKFSKFFACGGLMWVELIPQVISCFFRANSFTLTCNIL